MKTVFALRNGRSAGDSPSMTRSSTLKEPLRKTMLSLPMCIGRSKNLVPCCSAIFVSLGPTSTLRPVTMAAATSAMRTASARMSGCFLRFDFGADAGTLTAGAAAGGLTSGVASGVSDADGVRCSSATLFDDDEHAAGLDRRPGSHGDVLDASGLGRAQLVLHLHRLDDDDGLPALDFVADGDEHADDPAGHGRDDPLFTVRAAARVGGGPPRAAAVDGDGDVPAREAGQHLAGGLARGELD